MRPDSNIQRKIWVITQSLTQSIQTSNLSIQFIGNFQLEYLIIFYSTAESFHGNENCFRLRFQTQGLQVNESTELKNHSPFFNVKGRKLKSVLKRKFVRNDDFVSNQSWEASLLVTSPGLIGLHQRVNVTQKEPLRTQVQFLQVCLRTSCLEHELHLKQSPRQG